jgi:hypothetical protein
MKTLSNFGIIMDMLQIKASDIEKLGFDRTLVSRWRSGKRRIMPGRRFLAGLSELIWEFDGKLREQSQLTDFLRMCYPADACSTHEEKNALLLRLLTDVHQMEADNLERRGEKLTRLLERQLPGYDAPADSGNKTYGQRRLLAFMDKVLELAEPTHLYWAYLGSPSMLADADFARALQIKSRELFDAGHTGTQIVSATNTNRYMDRHFRNMLPYYISGKCRRYYCTTADKDMQDRIIGVIPGKCAVSISMEGEGDAQTTYSEMYYEAADVERLAKQIQAMLETAEPMMRTDAVRNPDGFLQDAQLCLDKPCYLFVRMPFWRIRSLERFTEMFMLTPEELARLQSEFGALTSSPALGSVGCPVRCVFCEDDIEDALLKRRTLMRELSDVVGRRVWITGAYVMDQLSSICEGLKNQKLYEVCIMPATYFDKLRSQMMVFGDETAIFWTGDGPSAACKVSTDVQVAAEYCEELWNAIPEYMRDRHSVRNKLERWILRGWDFTGNARGRQGQKGE